MAKNRGKKYQDALKKVDSKKKYAVNDAVQLVKDIDFANFDSTVEVAFKLNVDTKQADQQLRGAVVLPNGTVRIKLLLFSLRETMLRLLRMPVLTLLVTLT